ncbi:MAG: hypothetical protein QME66_05780 [Candidatus Eisenbacteria bacterium]|nr:hypothetical protein [Candidatus Eisenbacteria bacterium]
MSDVLCRNKNGKYVYLPEDDVAGFLLRENGPPPPPVSSQKAYVVKAGSEEFASGDKAAKGIGYKNLP